MRPTAFESLRGIIALTMTEPTTTAARRGARTEKETTASPEQPKVFQHRQYLEDRDGLQYLPLKWRLAWLRADHPQARITTKLVSHQDEVAVFKAEVELPEGGTATGWGAKARSNRTSDEFDQDRQLDYILGAENQALGRALAALGYGTEYAVDFDPPAEHKSIPLPERPSYESDDEEDGIEVPMGSLDTEAEIELPAEEDEVEEDLEGEDEDEEEVTPPSPTPINRQSTSPAKPSAATPAPRGEVRAIFEKSPAFETNRPTPLNPAKPVVSVEPSAPAPANPSINLVNPVVEERIKNVRDEALRMHMKQIYYEARRRFNYDEAKVDNRSKELYNKPTFELDSEEAAEYLERILTASQRRS